MDKVEQYYGKNLAIIQMFCVGDNVCAGMWRFQIHIENPLAICYIIMSFYFNL